MDEDNLDHVDAEIDVEDIEVVDEEQDEPEQTFTTFEDNSGEIAAVEDPEPGAQQEETAESDEEVEEKPDKKKKHHVAHLQKARIRAGDTFASKSRRRFERY